ncbi:HNH endonuclease [Fimbriiglobus ruber]|uniref:HNH endonuclease n=1 Tax=Fimbriiglobus ruber TaxID=1908690 RepID=UPI00137AE009|nr:HNH endonuclease [Fimbriiglobus ruber]
MDDNTLHHPYAERNEDYAGAVCWLLWSRKTNSFHQRQSLVDVEDFEAVKHLPWKMQKVGKKRYWRVCYGSAGETRYLARHLLNFPENSIVDHANRDTLDDRRKNLRTCTVAQNNLNRPGTGTSRKGIVWSPIRKKWRVVAAGYLIGHFEDEDEAVRAYNRYMLHHVGEFAYLNPNK